MPFPEPIKLEAKRRASFSCVVCKQPFVEVHHITPEAQGGPNTLDNAAPLCGSCHDLFGGNHDKRKQIREMRDFWWEVCEKSNANPDVVALNQKLDAIQTSVHSNQISQTQVLTEIKDAFIGFHNKVQAHISSSGTLTELSHATGSSIPTQLKHSQQADIPDVQQTILLILAGVESMPAEQIAKRAQVGQHVAEHHLDKLYDADMIWAEFATYGAPVCWQLMRPGRDYLVERGLLQ